jgi:integrase
MAKTLTDAAVRRLKPGKTRREIADGGRAGLYLVLQPTGQRSWAFRFHSGGKSVKLTLGGYDETARPPVAEPKQGADLTLAEARLVVARLDHERAGGTDVVVARKLAKIAARRKTIDDADNAYPALLRRYVDEHARPHAKRWRATARLIGLAYSKDGGEATVIANGLADRWAMRPVRTITPDDVYVAVNDAVTIAAPGLPRRRKPHARAEHLGRALHGALGAFFGWALRNRCIDTNPCKAVDKPRASAPRERVLSDQEITAVWHGCEKLAPPYAAMVKLLVLTGGRLREVAGLRWSELRQQGAELDSDLSVWTLPKERAKNRKEHRVALPKLAQGIIADVPRIAGSDFVLSFTGARPVDGHASVKHALDAASGVTGWTFHDLRRTVATGLQRLGVRLEVTEAVLNHVSGSRGGIVGVYQRHQYGDEKRAALASWADHVAALVGANVVTIVGRKTG